VLGVPGTKSTPRSTASVFLMTSGNTTPTAGGSLMLERVLGEDFGY